MPNYPMNCTTESAIYVMELTVMGWMPMWEAHKYLEAGKIHDIL